MDILSDYCRSKHCRQIHCHSTGFYSYLLLDAGFHYSLESGSSVRSVYDFRIDAPFEQLKLFIDGKHPDYPFDLEGDKLKVKYGLPRFVFFSKFLNLEKAALIEKSKALGMSSASSAEVNADLNLFCVYQKYRIPIQTQSVFSIESQFPLDDPFWRVVREIKKFSEANGRLPLYHSIPDIDCDSIPYQVVTRIFSEQSQKEWGEIKSKLPDVDPDFISTIAKNVYNLSGHAYEPISKIKDEKKSLLSYLFIAVRHFVDQKGRDPTDTKDDIQALISEIKTLGSTSPLIEDFVTYLCRFEGLAIPSVAGTFGAIVAQEITKLIIHKPTPIKGFAYYNAISESIDSS